MRKAIVAFLVLLGIVFAGQAAFAEEQFDDEALLPFIVPEEEMGAAPPVQTDMQEAFYRGRVVAIISEHQEEFGLNNTRPTMQKVEVEFLSGPREGEVVTIDYGSLLESQRVSEGQSVVIVEPSAIQGSQLYIFDQYRLPSLLFITALFVALAVLFSGWRGISSVIGLGVSVAVIAFWIVPRIIDGKDPLITSLLGAVVIATISIYLAHGFSRRISVAVASTLITITLAIGLAVLFVALSNLSGSGSEESYYLQISQLGNLNLRGLLLGGIIIGALGVLDDITTGQAAAVDEIWRANPALSRRELFKRGFSVGREHITALINTLALAYVGASMPALLLFTIYNRPWWVVANTEMIAEEVVRTLVGSIALMCAVPITTFLAAYFLPMQGSPDQKPEKTASFHKH